MTSTVAATLASEPIDIGNEDAAFSRGGNRLCFVDPRNRDRCIKVLRPDRSPERKRAERGFPKRLKPLAAFDDNRQEAATYGRMLQCLGLGMYRFIPRLHGWVNTNLGDGLCFDLVRDTDGRISITLKQFLWQQGLTQELEALLDTFSTAWSDAGMASRNLLLHNILVQCDASRPARLVVIDGIGWPDLFPLAYYLPFLARSKARRRVDNMHTAIDLLLERRAVRADYGYHGWLEESARQ